MKILRYLALALTLLGLLGIAMTDWTALLNALGLLLLGHGSWQSRHWAARHV